MLTDRLGLLREFGELFAYIDERWDGQSDPGHARGEAIPLPVRIVQVARDRWFQSMLGGPRYAARVIRRRAGGVFEPDIARALANERSLNSVPAPAKTPFTRRRCSRRR